MSSVLLPVTTSSEVAPDDLSKALSRKTLTHSYLIQVARYLPENPIDLTLPYVVRRANKVF